jgi:plasmid stabilization system protein ParE
LLFKIKIEQDALVDIQEITDWYNLQSKGLGVRFQKQVKTQINSLKSNPHIFAIRYQNIQCLLIKKFPFLVHYSIDEKNDIINIYAVFHTSRNPKIWKIRNSI